MATYINASGQLVDENGAPIPVNDGNSIYDLGGASGVYPSYEEYAATKPGATPSTSGLIDIKIPDYSQQYATDAASNQAWKANNAAQQNTNMGRQMYGRNAEEKRDAFAKMVQQPYMQYQAENTDFINPYPQYVTQGAVFKPGADGTNPFAPKASPGDMGFKSPAPSKLPPPQMPQPQTGAYGAPPSYGTITDQERQDGVFAGSASQTTPGGFADMYMRTKTPAQLAAENPYYGDNRPGVIQPPISQQPFWQNGVYLPNPSLEYGYTGGGLLGPQSGTSGLLGMAK